MRPVITLLCWTALGATTLRAEPDTPPTDAQVRAAIDRGIAFMLEDQNRNGSWGGIGDSLTTWSGSVWPNPETHRAWTVATTGLCVAALLEAGHTLEASASVERSVRYLIDNADVKRPNEWDTMNHWAYIYGLQGLVAAYGHPNWTDAPLRPRIAQAIPKYLEKLNKAQSLNGGWGYLEFSRPRTRQPQWATSFMTAAAVVPLTEAKRQGFEIDQAVVDRAVRIIKRCRLPNGGYTYRVRNVPNLNSEYIDQVKGSLSRIEVCQAALLSAGEDVPLDDLRDGLAKFFREHKFLELAMHKPVPHEAYYYNSGYFYMFGHYYASLIIDELPSEERGAWWSRLRHEVMKVQQKNGSMWDYDMHRYDRPYGTAYGLLALHRSLPRQPESPGDPMTAPGVRSTTSGDTNSAGDDKEPASDDSAAAPE